MEREKLISRMFIILAIIAIIAIIFTLSSCDSDSVRREKLGDEAHIMTDQNDNIWMIKHSYGVNYEIIYLGDSISFENIINK